MPERTIAADRVRFIKLGEGGGWEEECLRGGIVRLGCDTQRYFDLCNEVLMARARQSPGSVHKPA